MNTKPIVKHFGKVENGVLHFYNSQRYYSYLRGLNGKEFELIIEKKKEDISLDQYGYYFGGIIPTALQSNLFGGWTEDELDAFLVKKFLSKVVVKIIHDERIELRVTSSKTKISKDRFSKFIDEVLRFLSMEGVYVLSPQEYYLEKNKSQVEYVIKNNLKQKI